MAGSPYLFPAAAHPLLAVTEITGAAATGRIRAAAALTRDDIEQLFAAHIKSETTLQWDEPSASVRARRRRTYGELVLADDPVPPPDAEAAATLLADQEQHADAALTSRPQSLGGLNLRGQHALRIARAPAVQHAAFHTARNEGGNAVEVCGEDDLRRIEDGEHVRPPVGDFQLLDGPAEVTEVRRQPPAAVALPPRRRVDVDQRARERDEP